MRLVQSDCSACVCGNAPALWWVHDGLSRETPVLGCSLCRIEITGWSCDDSPSCQDSRDAEERRIKATWRAFAGART